MNTALTGHRTVALGLALSVCYRHYIVLFPSTDPMLNHYSTNSLEDGIVVRLIVGERERANLVVQLSARLEICSEPGVRI